MEKNKIIVTSYIAPDLDGVSAMYGYSEYLNKKSQIADYYISGTPKKEVDIVCELFNINLGNLYSNIENNDKIVIVDTNDINSLPKDIILDNVIEILDHHIKNDNIKEFKNAKIHIELIGAVATLVAEKFYNENIPISKESAILLYYGIISNSINLKAEITSQKDIDMANWLKSQYSNDIIDEKVREIFTRKSDMTDCLKDEMEADIRIVTGAKSTTIAQLELVDIDKFINENIIELKSILNDIKQEKKLDFIFLNCIDILNGYNMLVSIDNESKELIEDILKIKCENGIGKTEKIVMRKQIIPLIKNKFGGSI